jgi:hypothetical protein
LAKKSKKTKKDAADDKNERVIADNRKGPAQRLLVRCVAYQPAQLFG